MFSNNIFLTLQIKALWYHYQKILESPPYYAKWQEKMTMELCATTVYKYR